MLSLFQLVIWILEAAQPAPQLSSHAFAVAIALRRVVQKFPLRPGSVFLRTLELWWLMAIQRRHTHNGASNQVDYKQIMIVYYVYRDTVCIYIHRQKDRQIDI